VVNLPLQGAPAAGIAIAQANFPGPKWEYLYVGQPEKAGELPSLLRKYGEDGWELTTVLALGKDGVKEAAKAEPKSFVVTDATTSVMVMKRPVSMGAGGVIIQGQALPALPLGGFQLQPALPALPAVPAKPAVVKPGGPQG
jgi:hypothetical protein